MYLGDTSYDTAASYLSLAMYHAGIAHDYIPPDDSLKRFHQNKVYKLYVFSDYPASQLSDEASTAVLTNVENGAGLLMIGGWESYQGNGGGYHGTLLAEALPVRVSKTDDRVNSADPCCIVRCSDHPAIENLDFSRPPTIAGYNVIEADEGADVALEVVRYATLAVRDMFSPVAFEVKSRDPYLVFGSYGSGRTACLSSDLAPHWVGGFVDWGDERIRIAHDGREVEVGSNYVRFATDLIRWLIDSPATQINAP